MKRIPLRNKAGEVIRYAIVDEKNYETLAAHRWYLDSDGYACRTSSRSEGRKTVYMHNFIMGTPKGMMTDHDDRNKLNNRESNLIVCTSAENQRNRGKQKNNTSGYKGVSKKGKYWRASIQVDGKQIVIGNFLTPKEASVAYNNFCVIRKQKL